MIIERRDNGSFEIVIKIEDYEDADELISIIDDMKERSKLRSLDDTFDEDQEIQDFLDKLSKALQDKE